MDKIEFIKVAVINSNGGHPILFIIDIVKNILLTIIGINYLFVMFIGILINMMSGELKSDERWKD